MSIVLIFGVEKAPLSFDYLSGFIALVGCLLLCSDKPRMSTAKSFSELVNERALNVALAPYSLGCTLVELCRVCVYDVGHVISIYQVSHGVVHAAICGVSSSSAVIIRL